jgi:hypothetical protein
MTMNVQVFYFDVRTSELRIVVQNTEVTKTKDSDFQVLRCPNKTNGIL